MSINSELETIRMKKICGFMGAFAMMAILSAALWAHDDKIHKATIGEAAAVAADGLDLKTKTGVVKVKYSSRTKFERDKKPVDRSNVRTGEALGVIGNKLPTGELMAIEVLLGRDVQKELDAQKGGHKH
jgi:hypothetical protein